MTEPGPVPSPSPTPAAAARHEPADADAGAWSVEIEDGPAGEFHGRDPGPDPGHRLWVHRPLRPALVIGSTQPDSLIRHDRADAAGIEVCRRRSGGGLVYLDPRTDCWIDAVVPAGSPLWDDDVGLAFLWLGRRWASVLDGLLGPAGPALLHRPPSATRRGRPLWCFGEVGHGEVTIGGSKVVGLSQRRTRHWLRLQSLVLGAWPGRRLLDLLDLDALPDATGTDPGAVVAGPPAGLRLPPPAELARRFVDELPDPARIAAAEGP